LEHILLTAIKDLEQKLNLSSNDVAILLCEVSKHLFPFYCVPRSVSELLKEPFHREKLSLGCPIIDDLFKGGLPCRGLIEVLSNSIIMPKLSHMYTHSLLIYLIIIHTMWTMERQITGEAGSGKTNFCLQACLQTQLKKEDGGMDGFALYVTTEVSSSTRPPTLNN
jgi:predicted NACHT family NTPase